MLYNVRVNYRTFIDVEINAKDENEAIEKATMRVETMDYTDFTEGIRNNFVCKDEPNVFPIY